MSYNSSTSGNVTLGGRLGRKPKKKPNKTIKPKKNGSKRKR